MRGVVEMIRELETSLCRALLPERPNWGASLCFEECFVEAPTSEGVSGRVSRGDASRPFLLMTRQATKRVGEEEMGREGRRERGGRELF